MSLLYVGINAGSVSETKGRLSTLLFFFKEISTGAVIWFSMPHLVLFVFKKFNAFRRIETTIKILNTKHKYLV
jgi:hypothetical protein